MSRRQDDTWVWSVEEAATAWGVSTKRVRQYLAQGRVPGAVQLGRDWAIPARTPKPEDPRKERKTMRIREAVAEAAGVPVNTVGGPEILFTEPPGDISWVIVPLGDGRWAATDEAEIGPHHVTLFATRAAAMAYQEAGWCDAGYEGGDQHE